MYSLGTALRINLDDLGDVDLCTQQVCTDIIHLHDLKLHYYRGSFQDFEKMYEQRRVEANKAFEKYEKQMRVRDRFSSLSW